MKLTNIKVSLAYESPTNPRGTDFKGPAFDDLVASVKEKGVLVPVIARPKGERFEVVAGNRRLRAAKLAGLAEIPARVENFSDEEAREVQIIENLHREDVHPLEEGEAYRQLVETAKLEIASIAAKVGKSENYVRQRLFLTNLIPAVAKAYRKGEIEDGHAVLIARLSANDQARTFKTMYTDWTVGELKGWIERNIYSPLERQPWLTMKDAEKVVGKCVECKPTNVSLFGAVKAGACTDLKCWTRKMTAYTAHIATTEKRRQVSSEYSGAEKGVLGKSEYVIVPAKGKNRCESAHGAVVVQGSDIGKVFDICSNFKCSKHRGQTSHYELSPAEEAKRKAERKKEIAKKKREKEARAKKLETALSKVAWPLSEKHLDALLALAVENAGGNQCRTIGKRHGIVPKKGANEFTYGYGAPLKKWASEQTKVERLRLTFELLADTGYDSLREGLSQL